jgi:EAL domain-containing protein (putative c-di-GMP-specific phosphodiesterase class I)
MSNRTTIAQFARLACVLFSQLCCSLFKLYGALALLGENFWSEVMLANTLIDDLEARDQQRNICASLIKLALYHQLDLTAQDVDNEMQGYLLQVMGCTSGQGLLFDQPKTADQMALLFQRLPPKLSQAS